MNETLPLTVKSEGLFEKGDKSSNFLLTKLEAWLNFQALCANWYADDGLIVRCHLTFLPESHFYNKQLDSEKNWQNLNLPLAVYNHDKAETTFNVFIMLSNDELSDAMSEPKKVEAMLQNKLSVTVNQLVSHYKLNTI